MDLNRIIQALKGTIDPKLRIAAENELNQFSRTPWIFSEQLAHLLATFASFRVVFLTQCSFFGLLDPQKEALESFASVCRV
uniref:Importin N-terminal domain-containing protein n=1 Tax=Ailuropoda melanoleuca TaxID=9646 RepID=A0A7N5JBX9_AILME